MQDSARSCSLASQSHVVFVSANIVANRTLSSIILINAALIIEALGSQIVKHRNETQGPMKM